MSEDKELNSLKNLERLSQKAFKPDRFYFFKEISRFKKILKKESPSAHLEKKITTLKNKIERSVKKRDDRKNALPSPQYPSELPITHLKDKIIESIRENQVTIISGETGSGKTTQIPKFCLAAGRGIDGIIGCTQPRRIAAITVAERIAEELSVPLGTTVGYKIRFQEKTSPDAYINLMTDGILLAEAQKDPYLNKYDTIIVDEAHERSLNIDFILGILNNLIKKRKDLKLIITSATIDTEKFSQAFDNAPVIEVSGRLYPVEVRYLHPDTQKQAEEELTYVDLSVKAVETLFRERVSGDILIFMPTEQDIRETIELIEGRGFPGITILPLFARLSAADQKKVFSLGAGIKIVVATNVAETSITIPGIKYVIDTGLARISEYGPGTGTTSLPIKSISRSSADQRKGRCGRVQNGICIRLYEEEDYLSRPLYTAPEILRSNLAEVILKMVDLGLGDIESFPFIDKPSPKSIKDGFNTLLELDAISPPRNGKLPRLTKTGKIMASLPLDPKISRMLIEASKEGCLEEMSVIAAALSINDPKERPQDKETIADQKHRAFIDPYSDFLTLYNIWKKFQEYQGKGRGLGKIKHFCKEYFLSFRGIKEFLDIHQQISEAIKEEGILKETGKLTDTEKKATSFSPLYTAIHKSILSGYLSNIAFQKDKNMFKATKGRDVMIFPGSGLFNRAGQWVVAGEMVHTSRLFARTVARIESEWLEEIGKKHLTYTYHNPHWEKKRGEVVATQTVSLFGLTIISDRKISYGRIDREEASDIFIRCGLMEGEINVHPSNKHFSFLRHNEKLIENVRKMEDKLRRRDILIEEEAMFEFYKNRLKGITNIRSLEKIIKEKKSSDFLKMKASDLQNYSPEWSDLSLFPDEIQLGGNQFQFDYTFNPGDPKDGITIKIPSSVTNSVPKEGIDWVIPGLLREKIEALLKSLPKTYRKQLVPISNTVDMILSEMPKTEKPLITALGEFIHKKFNISIPAGEWSEESLPEHLKMRIMITDTNGKELKSGRDTAILNGTYKQSIKQSELEDIKKKWERSEIKEWNFGDLPDHIIIGTGNNRWAAYPTLTKDSQGICLKVYPDKYEAETVHPKGVAGLYELTFEKDMKALKKDIKLTGSHAKYADYFGGKETFESTIIGSVSNHLFRKNIRTEKEFREHGMSVSRNIWQTGQSSLKTAIDILNVYAEARSTIYQYEITGKIHPESKRFLEEMRSGLDKLLPANFMMLYEPHRLEQIVKYIKALQIRTNRGFENPLKDASKAEEIKKYTNALESLVESLSEKEVTNEKREAIENFFWLIEEFKVSIFAQELKTSVKVSGKILEKEYNRIQRMV